MKKIFPISAAVLFLTISALCWSVPVAAAGTYAYTEDFEDGVADTFQAGEQANPGTYEVVEEDGNHVCKLKLFMVDSDNGYVHYVFGPTVGDYFIYTLRYRSDKNQNPDYCWAKICYRCLTGDREGVGHGESECYQLDIWQWRAAQAIKSPAHFRGSINEQVQTENQDFTFDDGSWYDIRIEGRKNNFKTYVDGSLVFDWTDTKNYFPEGNFAFCAWGDNFSVDDIKIATFSTEAELNAGTIASSASSGSSSTSSSKSSSSSLQSAGTSSAAASSGEASSASAGESLVSGSGSEASSEVAVSMDVSSEAAAGSAESSVESASGTGESGGGAQTWVYIVIAAAVVAIGGGIALLLIRKKK